MSSASGIIKQTYYRKTSNTPINEIAKNDLFSKNIKYDIFHANTLPEVEKLKKMCEKKVEMYDESYNNYHYYRCILRVFKTILFFPEKMTEENIDNIILYILDLEIRDFNVAVFIRKIIQFYKLNSDLCSNKLTGIIASLRMESLEDLKYINPLNLDELISPSSKFNIYLQKIEKQSSQDVRNFNWLTLILENYNYKTIKQVDIQKAFKISVSLIAENGFIRNIDFAERIGDLFPFELITKDVFLLFVQNTIKVLNGKSQPFLVDKILNLLERIFSKCDIDVDTKTIQLLFEKSVKIVDKSKNDYFNLTFRDESFIVFLLSKFSIEEIGRNNIQLYFDNCIVITRQIYGKKLSAQNFVSFYSAINLIKYYIDKKNFHILDVQKLESFSKQLSNMSGYFSNEYKMELKIIQDYIKSAKEELSQENPSQENPSQMTKVPQCVVM